MTDFAAIALHHRLAKSGVTLRAGGGGTAEEMWYDEWTVFGDEALSALHTAEYEAEAKRRKEEK